MDGPYPSGRSNSFDISSDSGYGRAQTQRKGFRGTEENAKTKLCMRWLAGDCRFGPRCNFAHGEHELRKMPPKPGRFSQDTREREREDMAVDVSSTLGYSRASFESPYGHIRGRSNMSYYEYGGGIAANPYQSSRGSSGGFAGHVYGPGGGYTGTASPTMVQPSGPLHIPAVQPNAPPHEYYTGQQVYPVAGPNGWMMYRDPKSGEPYYHNHQLTITQWQRPDEWPL